jgi:hypothetical protein
VNVPTPGDVFAAFFAAGFQAGPAEVAYGPCDRIEAEPDPDEPVPFTLTDQAEAALDGTEPEPLPDPDPEVGGWVGWSDRSMLAPDLEPEAEP